MTPRLGRDFLTSQNWPICKVNSRMDQGPTLTFQYTMCAMHGIRLFLTNDHAAGSLSTFRNWIEV